MLTNLKELYGHQLLAEDGDMGHVKDFYFDDKTWAVRYLVVDTGAWLLSRRVLISPHAFGRLDRDKNILHVNLTRKQIGNSPALEWHQQVSRQYEIEYYRYYGCAAYWEGGDIWGFSGCPAALTPSKNEIEKRLQPVVTNYTPLHSTKVLKDYQILAADRVIGFLKDFVIDVRSWAIREIVLHTGHRFSGNEILISSSNIALIDYEASEMFVNLTKANMQRAAAPDFATIGTEYRPAESYAME